MAYILFFWFTGWRWNAKVLANNNRKLLQSSEQQVWRSLTYVEFPHGSGKKEGLELNWSIILNYSTKEEYIYLANSLYILYPSLEIFVSYVCCFLYVDAHDFFITNKKLLYPRSNWLLYIFIHTMNIRNSNPFIMARCYPSVSPYSTQWTRPNWLCAVLTTLIFSWDLQIISLLVTLPWAIDRYISLCLFSCGQYVYYICESF